MSANTSFDSQRRHSLGIAPMIETGSESTYAKTEEQTDAEVAENGATFGQVGSFSKKAKKFLVDEFHPIFYAPVMGTAISSNILYSFAFPARWLEICSYIMASISLLIFIFNSVGFVWALALRNGVWTKIHRDPKVAPFIGCAVMGYTALAMYLHAITRKSWIWASWVLWWIATALLVYTAFLTVFLAFFAKHRNKLNKVEFTDISFTYLLPVVTLTVAASMGGNVGEDLPNVNVKIITAVVLFLMWSIAIFLASIITTVGYWRLFTHKLPATGAVFTLFLPIGFLGQGAYGILVFGKNCVTMLMDNSDSVLLSSYTTFIHEGAAKVGSEVGNVATMMAVSIMVCTTAASLFLTAFGYFATFLAVASVLSKSRPFARRPNPACVYTSQAMRYFNGMLRFNRGFWSMTFPLGTMAQANVELWRMFNGFRAFRYVSALYSVTLFCITIGCLIGVIFRCIQMMFASDREDCKDKV